MIDSIHPQHDHHDDQITQETLDTLRSLHRELELEDAAEEPEEQV